MTKELLIQVESLQNLLISLATGHHADPAVYIHLRQVLLSNSALDAYIPRFVRTCRELDQFWSYIKKKIGTYEQRREFLYQEFQPLLDILERGGPSPSDAAVSTVLDGLDAVHVQSAWSKALDRRNSDPEGAITMARTLLESVCKHILDEMNVDYKDDADLPTLYRHTAKVLNLAPSQHTVEVFRQILGGCTAVVEGLGSLRNRLSDAHGKGKAGTKPAPRHAELVVNLAGTVASFLLATWKSQDDTAE